MAQHVAVGDAASAEQSLWRWAVDQLDDEVLVLPQVAMTVGRGGRVEEAEADLVLLDPGHGITVVEVKGGTLLYDATQAAESEAIMRRLGEVYRSGAPADSEAAMGAVEAHRLQITRRFYDCSHEMQVQLGESYVQDPRFAATYDAIEPGLAFWVRDAVRANAERAASS